MIPLIKEKLQEKAKKLKFSAEAHKYTIGNMELISVSALVEMYKEQFDATGEITARCAAKKGITPREMADEWKAKNKESTDKGTEIHQICENFLKGYDTLPEGITQEIALKVPLIKATCEELKPYLISSEQIIYNEEIGVAGTTDALCYYNGKVDIFDFKTDKKPIEVDDNRYNKYFLPPLQDLPANSFYYYALKMSIYKHILELDGFDVNTLGLLHIRKDKIEEIILPNLKWEVLMILDDYKKKQEMMTTQSRQTL